MLKLFRYLKKAYVPVIAIVLFLVVQASCDLTLPTFTSNIVNVGIQQKGIERRNISGTEISYETR